MDIKELKAFTRDELILKLKTLKEELSKLTAQRYTGSVEKPHKFSLVKRDIARVNTLLNAKKDK